MSYRDLKTNDTPMYFAIVIVLIFIALVFTNANSKEYYDMCNGKEYTVSKNVLIASDNKDHNITEIGIPFAPWIRCTDKDMNITKPKNTIPNIININGKTYKLENKPLGINCVPFGDKIKIGDSKSGTYWRKCRRPNSNDWQET